MKRFAAGLVAFAFAVSACAAGFDFRTTGTTTTEIFNFKPTPAVPPVSNPQWGKLFVPAAGVPGYSAGNFYISQNGGPWTLLSSFVGSGVVTTVFGRTGAVTAVSGDYTCALVTGCMNQSGANTLTYSAGTPLRIKPSSAPAANTKEIDVQATGGGSTVFSVDYEGDVVANSLTLTSGTTGTGAYVLATSPTISSPTITTPTITTPTIASFVNATHTHQNAAGGGTLDTAAIATGTLAVARGGTGTTTSTGTGSNVLSASPAFTGTPTAPTATLGTNTTQLATTAFVASAVAASGSSYNQTIDEEGTPLTQRPAFNFVGSAITAADNAGANRTDVTLAVSPSSATVVGTGRSVATSAPLSGGGDLSADRTLSCPTCVITTRNVATTSPLTGGGTLASDLTLACPTCLTSATLFYQTIAEEGSNLTQRPKIDFIGNALTAADNVPGTKTTVTLSQSPSGSASVVGIGRTVNTTAPLTGGGDLSVDRTLAIDIAPIGATTAVGTTRIVDTTSPITGGGDLSANRNIQCGTCVTTDTTQSISGSKTFSSVMTSTGGITATLGSGTTPVITAGHSGTHTGPLISAGGLQAYASETKFVQQFYADETAIFVCDPGPDLCPNMTFGNAQKYTLTASVGIGAIFNLKAGALYQFRFIEDATGGRSITSWLSAFKWLHGTPVFNTSANASNVINCYSDGLFLYCDGGTQFEVPGDLTVDGDSTFTGNVEFDGATSFSAGLAVSGQFLQNVTSDFFASSLTINWNSGNNRKLTLTGNVTTLTLSNPQSGARYKIEVIQDSTGSRTITWPASVKWPNPGTAPNLGNGNDKNIIDCDYDGTDYLCRATNYAL
jgi:hypothetical protein